MLLLCLDKVLEKVFMQKLGEIVLRMKLTSFLYFRILVQRLAVNVIATFIHDIKKA